MTSVIETERTTTSFDPLSTSPFKDNNHNAITLTFQGVDFCLVPSAVPTSGKDNIFDDEDSGCGITLVPDQSGTFTKVHLTSFTGTLCVSSSSIKPLLRPNQQQSHVPRQVQRQRQVPDTPAIALATTVEDEESSPNKTSVQETSRAVVLPPKGQQQLPFERKKRVRSDVKDKQGTITLNSFTGPDDSKHNKKKSDQEIKRRKRNENRNIESSKSYPTLTNTETDTDNQKQKEEDRIETNIPLLGQSTMSSQTSDILLEEPEEENVMDITVPHTVLKKTLVEEEEEVDDEEKNNREEEELIRKPSIQELVDRAGDLTQTHNRNGNENDELSLTTAMTDFNSNNNAIVEFDNVEVENESIDGYDVIARDATKDESSECRTFKVDENIPCARWGQTMTMIEDSKFLVYGGQGIDSKTDKLVTFSDLHVYDLNQRAWKKPVNCEGMPRCWHTSTLVPDRSLVISFGGESYNPKTKKTTTTDQVMVLDTEIMLWYPPSVSGQIPSGRSGHSASYMPKTNKLVVFGGVKNNKWQNSLAVLDTIRWKWTAPKVSGDTPRARSYHSSTAVPLADKDGCLLVIFGGNNDIESFNTVHVLDTTDQEGKWSWSHPNVTGTPPCPRTGHCATLLEDNKTILVYGGWDPCDDDENVSDENMIFGDSFLLNTETWHWKPGPKPTFMKYCGVENGGRKRTGASSVLAPGNDLSQALVFGGRGLDEKFANDFQSMTVPSRMIGM